MPSLLRLTYASRARFDDVNGSAGIHPEVSRILIQSRRNNPRSGLVGALYFGDGCFFQVLEGPAAEVEALYQRLHVKNKGEAVYAALQRGATLEWHEPNGREVDAGQLYGRKLG